MKICPYCAEEIQDAAVVCKHCGRDLPAVILPPPAETRGSVIVKAVVYGICLLGALTLVIAFATGGGKSSARVPLKTLDVKVAWGSTSIKITNTSSPGGGEMIVYLNDLPPSGYKAVSQVPAVGESVLLSLREFTTSNGERFNPLTKAVTVAWVGGDGFDYASFGGR